MKQIPSNKQFVDNWRKNHRLRFREFIHGQHFVDGLIPQIAVQLNIYETLSTLKDKLGNDSFFNCINPDNTFPSPVSNEKNGQWLKKTNIVGVNIRTIGNFFNLVKYCFTLSQTQNCIHLLPIWEPGVVNSLYGKVSWNINPEFFSHELVSAYPHLDTVEKQLKVVINFVHAMGKTIGMDVIPHCDRFSEMVISKPYLFEWVKQKDGILINHDKDLYLEVQQIVWDFLIEKGSANHQHVDIGKEDFFSVSNSAIADSFQLEVIFGYQNDVLGRRNRRTEIMQRILDNRIETLPMTMAPPYRGLHLNPESFELDSFGNKWYNYEFDKPQEMSRVFGPLTRYRFFKNQKDSWQLDFENPVPEAWSYLAEKYAECQKEFNFDFMRGDMAHVQPRADGVPNPLPFYYDPLLFIKKYIANHQAPYFAFYAETFLAPDDVMSYGNEADHLNAIEAEATLGDLQSTVLGSFDFRQKLSDYIAFANTQSFAPSFTIITADKDDPRFDKFYHYGNVARYFIGQFFQSLPSYFSLGFETRERNIKRAANETYSKLYVFTIRDIAEKDKFTLNSFQWSSNFEQFNEINKLKSLQDTIIPQLKSDKVLSNILTDECLIWQNSNLLFAVSMVANQPITLKSSLKKKIKTTIYEYNGAFSCSISKLK